MTRYMLEKATGFATGSAYSDDRLTAGGFKGEGRVDGVLAVKTHEPHRGGQVRVSALVDRAIFLARDPYAAIVSYYEHLLTKSHTSSFRRRLLRHDSLASREFSVWSVEILEEVSRTYEYWVRLQDIRKKWSRKEHAMQNIPDRAAVTASETAATAGRLETLWVRYEDIMDRDQRRNEKELLRILEFLGLSPSRFSRRVRCAVQYQDDVVYQPKTNKTQATRRLSSSGAVDRSLQAAGDEEVYRIQQAVQDADVSPLERGEKCAKMHETDRCIAEVVIRALEDSPEPDTSRLAQLAREDGRSWPPVLNSALGSAGVTTELAHGALENMTLCHPDIVTCIRKDCYLPYYPVTQLFRSLVAPEFREILRRFDYRPSLLAITEEVALLQHLKDGIKKRMGRTESRKRAAELFAGGVQSTAQCPSVLRQLVNPAVFFHPGTRLMPKDDAEMNGNLEKTSGYVASVNARREALRKAARERMLRRRAILRARGMG